MRLPFDSSVREDVRDGLAPNADGFKLLGTPALVAVAVRAGVRCREVPKARCHRATDLDGHAQVAVECRCGYRPVLDLGAVPVKCECERWFYYAGTAVFALAGPAD